MNHDPVRADLNAHLKQVDEDDRYDMALESRAKDIKQLILDGDYYHGGHRYGPADISQEIADDDYELQVMDVYHAQLALSPDPYSADFRTAAYQIQQCVNRGVDRLAVRFAKKEMKDGA